MGGKIGVDGFVLISGYFLVFSSTQLVDLKRLFRLWSQVFIYSFGIFCFCIFTDLTDLNTKQVIKSFLPIIFSTWWFASTYFVMYLLHPFINKMLLAFNKQTYQLYLIILFVCWSVIPTFSSTSFQSNSLTWFVFLYSLAGYIRLYKVNDKFKQIYCFRWFFIISVFTYMISCFFIIIGTRWNIFASYSGHFYNQNSIFILLISVLLFMAFLNKHIKYCNYINILSSATFGVYLIHDNKLLRTFLWDKVFNVTQYQDCLLLIPYSIVVVFLTYFGCTIIELIRKYTIEPTLIKISNNKLEVYNEYINTFFLSDPNSVISHPSRPPKDQ